MDLGRNTIIKLDGNMDGEIEMVSANEGLIVMQHTFSSPNPDGSGIRTCDSSATTTISSERGNAVVTAAASSAASASSAKTSTPTTSAKTSTPTTSAHILVCADVHASSDGGTTGTAPVPILNNPTPPRKIKKKKKKLNDFRGFRNLKSIPVKLRLFKRFVRIKELGMVANAFSGFGIEDCTQSKGLPLLLMLLSEEVAKQNRPIRDNDTDTDTERFTGMRMATVESGPSKVYMCKDDPYTVPIIVQLPGQAEGRVIATSNINGAEDCNEGNKEYHTYAISGEKITYVVGKKQDSGNVEININRSAVEITDDKEYNNEKLVVDEPFETKSLTVGEEDVIESENEQEPAKMILEKKGNLVEEIADIQYGQESGMEQDSARMAVDEQELVIEMTGKQDGQISGNKQDVEKMIVDKQGVVIDIIGKQMGTQSKYEQNPTKMIVDKQDAIDIIGEQVGTLSGNEQSLGFETVDKSDMNKLTLEKMIVDE